MDFSENSLDKLPPIDRNRELLKTARSEVYKTAGTTDLNVYIWEPEPDKTPADWQTSTISAACSGVAAKGFSQKTARTPACTAARTIA